MSNPPNGYHTKQRTAVLAFLAQHPNAFYTVDSLSKALEEEGLSVGKTTVYRTLCKLTETGAVRRFSVPSSDSTCYQYIGENHTACASHFHLKCLVCGILLHVDCEQLQALGAHLQAEHGFSVDYSQTVLYGICSRCHKT